MSKKICSKWYLVFKNQFFGLTTLFLILAILLSGCGATTLQNKTDIKIPDPALKATLTPTPAATPEIIHQRNITQLPEIEQSLSGTVTLWHSWSENELVALQKVINRFVKKNPDVTVNLQYVPFDDLYNKYMSAARGDSPDLMIGPSKWGPGLFDAGLVTDVSTIFRQKFFEKISRSALQAVNYKRAITGMPIAYGQGIVIIRNQSILPEAPQTFEEYLEQAKEKTRGDIVGAVLDLGFFQSGAFLKACGGELMDAQGAPQFDNEAGLCWIGLLKQIFDYGLPVEMNTNVDLERFQTGKVGFIIAGTWDVARLSEAIGEDNLAIDPWPVYENENLSGYIDAEAVYLSDQVAPENQEASRALVRFFLTAFAQNILADPLTSAKIPVHSGIEVRDRLMEETLAAFKVGTPLPAIPQMDYYWDPMNVLIRSVLFEGQDPEQALEKAANQIKSQRKR
jgi:maltose-binding protein MalE